MEKSTEFKIIIGLVLIFILIAATGCRTAPMDAGYRNEAEDELQNEVIDQDQGITLYRKGKIQANKKLKSKIVRKPAVENGIKYHKAEVDQ